VLGESDIRELCLAFADAVETISWQRPTWFARTLLARMYDDRTLSIKSTEAQALIASHPDTFLMHPYGRGQHDKVLLTESYRLAGGSCPVHLLSAVT